MIQEMMSVFIGGGGRITMVFDLSYSEDMRGGVTLASISPTVKIPG